MPLLSNIDHFSYISKAHGKSTVKHTTLSNLLLCSTYRRGNEESSWSYAGIHRVEEGMLSLLGSDAALVKEDTSHT